MTNKQRSSNYTWNESVLALPPGEWVRDGLVWVYQEDPNYDPITHGTERGYQQHRYYGVPQCDDCREAHRLEWHHAKQRVAA